MTAAQPLLDFEAEPQLDPIEALASRSTRLANLVESISRRRDVRSKRSQILILLLDRVCPTGCRPRRRWYVPGAVARFGPESIRRAWRKSFDGPVPTERTIRAHLGVLEAACAIQRAPGDFQPCRRSLAHPERRPRFQDTIHVLDSDQAAEFWAGEGEARLLRNPDARTNPYRWRMLFANWRAEAATGSLFDLSIEEPKPEPTPAPVRASREGCNLGPTSADRTAGHAIAALLRRAPESPFAFVSALRSCGVHLHGPNVNQLLRDYDRLAGAAALLALGLLRPGQRIRSREGWLVRQFKHAGDQEVADALRAIARKPQPLPPDELPPNSCQVPPRRPLA